MFCNIATVIDLAIRTNTNQRKLKGTYHQLQIIIGYLIVKLDI